MPEPTEQEKCRIAAEQIDALATSLDNALTADVVAALGQNVELGPALIELLDGIDAIHEAAVTLVAVTGKWRQIARQHRETA